jgi:hypothetical protein
MRKVMLHGSKIGIFVAAIALASVVVSADALARGGGGHGVGGLGGGHGMSAPGAAGGFGSVPGLVPPGAFEENSPEGRSATGLNFNSQLRRGATGAVPNAGSTMQPQGGSTMQPEGGSTMQPQGGSTMQPEDGMMNAPTGTDSNGQSGTDSMP